MLLRIEAKVAVVFLDGIFASAIETFHFPLPGLCRRVAAAYTVFISIPTGCITASLPSETVMIVCKAVHRKVCWTGSSL